MIGFLLRRFRWMAIGAGVRFVARRGVGRSVDQAAAQLEERLPAPVAKVASVLPGDVVKAGGAAIVSARAAQQGARAAQKGGVVAARVTKAGVQAGAKANAMRPRPDVANRIRAVRSAIDEQSSMDERELRADFLRYQGDHEGATDALLDLRDPSRRPPIPEIPEPVEPGRRRFVRRRSEAPVARVQRSYRRPTKPWDRPPRKTSEPPTLGR